MGMGPHGGGWHTSGHEHGGGPFGVRRPLRFLSYKLDLDERQAAKLAKILDELKTERAQAAVDERRSTAAFAEAVEGETFDDQKANQAANSRVESAERLRNAVTKALRDIHAMLEGEQRENFAYLIRSGALQI